MTSERTERRDQIAKYPLRTNAAQRYHAVHGTIRLTAHSPHGHDYAVTRHASITLVLEGPHTGQWHWLGYLLDEVGCSQHEHGLPGGFCSTRQQADAAAQAYVTDPSPLA